MQGLILAAGMGKRLKELTQNNTKCMVKVNGRRLIDRMLHQLDKCGLSRIIIVVGYQRENLINYIGTLDINTPICFVENTIYDKTNNIYSLALAREYLIQENTLLLESDLIFEDEVLQILLDDPRDTLALVDKFESWMDGTCIKLGKGDERDSIEAFVPGRKFVFEDIPQYYKTVNIYKFSKHFSETHYVPFLEAYSKALGNNEYYEQVLRVITMLDEPVIKAKRLNGQLWYEIDDIQDLDIASSMFEVNDEQKLANIQARYGGYWRYPKMLNFSYPGNPFFPPKRLVNEMKANIEKLISEYPSGMDVNSLLAAKNLGIQMQNVVVANGVEELIKSMMSLSKGAVGIVYPTNEEYVNRCNDLKLCLFVPDNTDLAYTIDEIMSFIEANHISMFILTNPEYHSGHYIKKKEVLQLINWCGKRKVTVLIDESYCDFAEEKNNSLLINDDFRKFSNLVIIKNLSVSRGIAGLRLGCAVSQNQQLLDKIKKDVAIWNINSLAEFYLQIEEKYSKDYWEAIDTFKQIRKQFIEGLEKIEGIRIIPTQANYVMCEVLGKVLSASVVSELLNVHNILVKDLTDRVKNGCQYIKIAIRKPKENQIFIKALREVMQKSRLKPGRILGKAIDIDEREINKFFDNRINKELPHRYNYVIYQDSNPQLAIVRDKKEKEKMKPFLQAKPESDVLDIGCGVGRWGDEFVKILTEGEYVGVDFSDELLKIARENLGITNKCCFLQGAFQNVEEILMNNKRKNAFDIILINGVLMYINDKDIRKCLNSAIRLMKKNGRIYIKESVGIENRFTLEHFYSDELTDTYNAIYRSLQEYENIFESIFPKGEYKLISSGETWEKEQQNRRETTSYYWVYKKMGEL